MFRKTITSIFIILFIFTVLNNVILISETDNYKVFKLEDDEVEFDIYDAKSHNYLPLAYYKNKFVKYVFVREEELMKFIKENNNKEYIKEDEIFNYFSNLYIFDEIISVEEILDNNKFIIRDVNNNYRILDLCQNEVIDNEFDDYEKMENDSIVFFIDNVMIICDGNLKEIARINQKYEIISKINNKLLLRLNESLYIYDLDKKSKEKTKSNDILFEMIKLYNSEFSYKISEKELMNFKVHGSYIVMSNNGNLSPNISKIIKGKNFISDGNVFFYKYLGDDIFYVTTDDNTYLTKDRSYIYYLNDLKKLEITNFIKGELNKISISDNNLIIAKKGDIFLYYYNGSMFKSSPTIIYDNLVIYKGVESKDNNYVYFPKIQVLEQEVEIKEINKVIDSFYEKINLLKELNEDKSSYKVNYIYDYNIYYLKELNLISMEYTIKENDFLLGKNVVKKYFVIDLNSRKELMFQEFIKDDEDIYNNVLLHILDEIKNDNYYKDILKFNENKYNSNNKLRYVRELLNIYSTDLQYIFEENNIIIIFENLDINGNNIRFKIPYEIVFSKYI